MCLMLMEEIKRWYDALAEGYEELYGEEQEKKIEYILSNYRKLFGSKIYDIGLDFGCGTGISLKLLQSISKIQYACDISSKMLQIARQRFPEVKFINCTSLQRYENFFDVITSITVLQDVNNPSSVLELLSKVLKDKGILILSVLKRRGIEYWKPLVKKYFTILWFGEEEKDYVFFLGKKF